MKHSAGVCGAPKWCLPGMAYEANNSSTMKNSNTQKWGQQTRSVHAGEPNRHGVGAPVGPNICRTSTFTFSSTAEMKLCAEGKSKAYIYTRYGNPTLTVAQEKIAALEGAEAAVVTASGMAAISSALLGALKAGDELFSTPQLYGGSYGLMGEIFLKMGIPVNHVEPDSLDWKKSYLPRPKCCMSRPLRIP